jgi:hypothetical protein
MCIVVFFIYSFIISYLSFKTNLPVLHRRFAHDLVRNCYSALSEQFDVLLDAHVIWEPYPLATIQAWYPGGISDLCDRDWQYRMTKSKIIFDASIEEMAQQRVMRQFVFRQEVDPPPGDVPLASFVRRYSNIFNALHSAIVFHIYSLLFLISGSQGRGLTGLHRTGCGGFRLMFQSGRLRRHMFGLVCHLILNYSVAIYRGICQRLDSV